MHFYETRRLDIPVFLHEHQRKDSEISDKSLEVEAYVDEHLTVKPGAKLLQRDILDDFRKLTQVEELSFRAKDFFAALGKAIAEKGLE